MNIYKQTMMRILIALTMVGMSVPAVAMEQDRSNKKSKKHEKPEKDTAQYTVDEIVHMNLKRFKRLVDEKFISRKTLTKDQLAELRRRVNDNKTVAKKLAILNGTNEDELESPLDTLREQFLDEGENGEHEVSVLGAIQPMRKIYLRLKRQDWPIKGIADEAVDFLPSLYVIMLDDATVETLKLVAEDLSDSETVAEIIEKIQERVRKLANIVKGEKQSTADKIQQKINKILLKRVTTYRNARIVKRFGAFLQSISTDIEKTAKHNEKIKASAVIKNALDKFFDVMEELYLSFIIKHKDDKEKTSALALKLKKQLKEMGDTDAFLKKITKKAKKKLALIVEDARIGAGMSDNDSSSSSSSSSESDSDAKKSKKKKKADKKSKKDKKEKLRLAPEPKKAKAPKDANNNNEAGSTEGLLNKLHMAFEEAGLVNADTFDKLQKLVKDYPKSGYQNHAAYVENCVFLEKIEQGKIQL